MHAFVRQDTTYRIGGAGFSYPHSLYTAEHILENSCNGQDLHYKDVAMTGLKQPFSYCNNQSGSTIEYTPHLNVYHNGGIEYNQAQSTLPPQSEFSINDVFFVKTYINNVYLRTDTLDPTDTGGAIDLGGDDITEGDIGPGIDWDFLLPTIQVQINDSVKFELLYPEDSYMNNNTYSFKVEQQDETKTASSNLLRLAFDNPNMYAYFCTEEQVSQEFAGLDIIIFNGGNDTLLTINNGECYDMSVVNAHCGNAYLIQSNNNDTIFKHTPGGTNIFSKFYYFNVDSTATSIIDYNAQAKLISAEYFDLLGKKQKTNIFSHLAKGVFVEVKRFDNGHAEQRKVLKLE